MVNYIIALDVGGTYIKAGVACLYDDHGFGFIGGNYSYYPSKSTQDRNTVLRNFEEIIEKQIRKIPDETFLLQGLGLGFPGPFDYQGGISYIKGISKFESIYGVNIREELTAYMTTKSSIRSKIGRDFSIMFDNDVNLFALGECAIGKAKNYKKTLCVSIGTGFNSAFTAEGKLVKDHPGIPKDGWIYNCDFREGIVDDYASKRGILRIVRENGWDDLDMDIRDLSAKALSGDRRAESVFHQFGSTIGEAIRPYVKGYKPDAIFFGGQISNSFLLFRDDIRLVLDSPNIVLDASDDSVISTLAGAVKLIVDSMPYRPAGDQIQGADHA